MFNASPYEINENKILTKITGFTVVTQQDSFIGIFIVREVSFLNI